MTDTAPALYKVIYSELVQAALREFVARAAKVGHRDSFLEAVKELDRLLHLYPQFGEPLTDLKQEVGQVYCGTVLPLVVRYAVLEARRLVFVGAPPQLLANAGLEFGKRHAQEAVLIARKLKDGEHDPAERLGLILTLHVDMTITEAVRITEVVRVQGFTGATFVPGRSEVAIYHTDDLHMTTGQFRNAVDWLVAGLRAEYPQAQYTVKPYLVLMPTL